MEAKKCPRCQTEFKIGKTIYPFQESGTLYDPWAPVATADNLELIDCWKCPNCGHSEEK